jgi:uncharacterized protein YqeY
MSKKSELEDALKEAMRAKDSMRRNTLRLVLSAIKEAEVSKQAELDDAAIMSLVQKAVKIRQEAEEEAKRAERDDLIEEARQEISILEEYLPAAMSDEALTAIIEAAIEKSGASSQKEMGEVMKLVLPEVQGKADGAKVSQIVRQKLQGE